MVKYKKYIFYVCLFILLFIFCSRGTAFPDTLRERCQEALRKDIKPNDPHNSIDLVKDVINEITGQKRDYLESSLYPEMREFYERLQLKLGNYYFQEKEFNKALECFIEADRYSSRGYNEKIAHCKTIIENEKKIEDKLKVAVEYYQMTKYDMAKEVFLKAQELKPQLPKTQEFITTHLQKIAQWEKVDDINPDAFVRFKRENKNALILDEFKKKLYDAFPKLPPEDYLQYLEPERNSQMYWEAVIDGHAMVYIPAKEIFVDKYEVSYAQLEKLKPFKKKRKKLNKRLSQKLTVNHPAVVGFNEAEIYCKKKGFRLLTEEEWEFIAGKKNAKDDHPYPWGKEEVDALAVYRANYESFDDGNDFVAEVKSYESKYFASPYGIVNLAGNVWEWVREKKCKGGGFLSGKQDLKIASYSENEVWVGFRCAREVK